jgi:hypothetical protein
MFGPSEVFSDDDIAATAADYLPPALGLLVPSYRSGSPALARTV